MSISSISTSNSSLYSYQWNNQQLQGSTTSSSSNTSSYAFQGTSTVSSMVELAMYAMESMGVASNERVTFSQIEKYKEELETTFSKNLNASIESLNISSDASFTVNLAADGTIKIDSSHEDSAKIQAYFDVYPEMANNLRTQLDTAGFEGDVQFTVNGSGDISGVSSSAGTKSIELEDSTLGTDILAHIASTSEDETVEILPFSIVINNGAVQLDDDSMGHQHSEAILGYFTDDPNLAQEIQNAISAEGITGEVRVYVNSEGKVNVEQVVGGTSPETEAENNAALYDFLVENSVGDTIKNALASVGIDPNIDFRLTVEDGKVVVNSSHPDAVKVQALIDANEELTKDYLQVDALAGLEGARKSMQVDPSTMRTRIQMESMVAWWANTGTSNIGSFSSGDLSSFTGVNSVV